MNFDRSVITLTFGDAAENHVGMEMLGSRGAKGTGFTVAELNAIAASTPRSELYHLPPPPTAPKGTEAAAVLVIRAAIAEAEHRALFEEQAALEHDKKSFMYGRVVNKKARWNLCFDSAGSEPDYASGKGRVVAMSSVPRLATIVTGWGEAFGPKANATGLKGEGNYYYDLTKCGIGWHGDTERRKVIALRLGAPELPIHYQWYNKSAPQGPVISIPLRGGDMYIMSEKAVGADWKHSAAWTLRHATGVHSGI